jgi:hypothetical protein
VESADVLPSLLHEGDEEVDGHGEVLPDVVLASLNSSDGSAEAGGLLGLELDGVLELVNFSGDLLALSQSDGEEAHLDEDVSEELGGLLGDGIAGEQDVVLLGPLLDFVLVLVKGLEAVDVDEGDAVGSGLLDVGSIGEHADLGGGRGTLMLL